MYHLRETRYCMIRATCTVCIIYHVPYTIDYILYIMDNTLYTIGFRV